MYHTKLPIPNEFLWVKEKKVAFRYAYAIVRKKRTSTIELLSEDNWRLVEVASDSGIESIYTCNNIVMPVYEIFLFRVYSV